jgi:hypothetical protein
MSDIRFLDNVAVESFASNTGTVDIYLSGSLIASSVQELNFTGSGVDIQASGSTGVLITISGSGQIGPPGPSGSAGPSGSIGPSGSEGSLAQWRYSTSTDVGTDPGAGYFRLDTAWNSGLTSKLAIDDISYYPSINLGPVLNSITPNTIIKLFSVTDSTVYKYLQITSIAPYQPGYEVYDVTDLGYNGTPSNNDQIGIVVSAATSLNFSGSHLRAVADGSTGVIITATPFPYTGSAGISGSLNLEGPFLVRLNDGNGDSTKFQVNNEGVTVLGKLDTTPTAVSGGMFYSASNEFFFGFE